MCASFSLSLLSIWAAYFTSVHQHTDFSLQWLILLDACFYILITRTCFKLFKLTRQRGHRRKCSLLSSRRCSQFWELSLRLFSAWQGKTPRQITGWVYGSWQLFRAGPLPAVLLDSQTDQFTFTFPPLFIAHCISALAYELMISKYSTHKT